MLGDTIKILREGRGLTQAQLASQLGVSRDTVCNWENGRTKIDAEYMRAISKTLKYSSDYILNYEYETEEAYNARFDKINGLMNWAIRDEYNADMVKFMSNQFDGNFDGVVLMSYLYSKLPARIRKHISATIIYTFRAAMYEGKTDMSQEEFDYINNRYIDLWRELDKK